MGDETFPKEGIFTQAVARFVHEKQCIYHTLLIAHRRFDHLNKTPKSLAPGINASAASKPVLVFQDFRRRLSIPYGQLAATFTRSPSPTFQKKMKADS
jgi:hypothetical protein